MNPKRQPYRNKKIRESAKGKACQIQGPNCNGNPETVVWCHSNMYEDGKGGSQKADDIFGAYGCFACHADYDAHRISQEDFHRAMKRSWRIMIDTGVIK